MKIISWNVNGIRAALKKGFVDFVAAEKPDILCLQEVKARAEQVVLPVELAGYEVFWNAAEKPGYSGTAVLTKKQPEEVRFGLDDPVHDTEGRVITLRYADFFVVTVYTPNSQDGLRRLAYRQEWDAAFLAYLKDLEAEGLPVLMGGDLNVSHREIDLARPAQNRKSAGFSDEERAGFDNLVEGGFADSFRHFHPEKEGAYSWWSYRGGARARNVGWRLDYWCVSEALRGELKGARILSEVMGSDHCPVEVSL